LSSPKVRHCLQQRSTAVGADGGDIVRRAGQQVIGVAATTPAAVKLALPRHQLADRAAIEAENNVERSAMARYSAEEKQEVHAAFEAILDQLDALERQPDSWEESYLVHALSYMGAGIYNRAKTELRE